MNTIFAILFGIVVGAIGAVIYYRRNTAKIEAALAEAVVARDKIEKAYLDLKSKVGG